MKSLNEILNTIKNDLENDIPDLLYAEDLSDFDVYAIGSSRNSEELGLFVYKSNLQKNARQNTLSVIIFAQLYGVNTEQASKYEDILVDYCTLYNPSDISMDYIENIDSDTWPLDETASTMVGIEITFIELLDSCD